MPKKNHRRGGAGENKHIGGFDEVMRRNANDGKDLPKGKGKGKAQDEWESSSGDEEEPEPKPQEVKPKKKEKGEGGDEPKEAKEAKETKETKEAKPPKEKKEKEHVEDEFQPLGAESRSAGPEITRKQREEMQKEAARRRYEELHKAGKTDEAKADLARLKEVKERREEATRKKAEADAAEKEKKAGKSKDKEAKAEMKELLGGEAAKLRGTRSSLKKQESGVEVGGEVPGDGLHKRGVEDPSLYTSFRVEGTSVPVKNTANEGKVKDGTIRSCREAEDDFM